jgi:hypothetical protein
MTGKSFCLTRAGEMATFRVLSPGLLRLKRTKDGHTLEIRVLRIAEARQRWQEMKCDGYRVLRDRKEG